MVRKHHDATPPNIQLAKIEDPNIITQIREYQLITPLFGGGVKAGENDSLTPIRGTEIRGQLRYWWRACRGGKPEFEEKHTKMKQAEDRIWGTATLTEKKQHVQKIHETVQIQVEVLQPGDPQAPFVIPDKKPESRKYVVREHPTNDIPLYAAFPLQPQEKDLSQPEKPKIKMVQEGIAFRLTISFPRSITRKEGEEEITEGIEHEIEAALWAWETFGGVGARNRRGFGALKCTKLVVNGHEKAIDLPPEQPLAARKWLQNKLDHHCIQNAQWPRQVPHLPSNLIDGENFYLLQNQKNGTNPKKVWYALIAKLRSFRQWRLDNGYGRTQWPEPNVIRQIIQKRTPDRPIFPRAAFGLPIIFHFQKPRQNRNGNPHQKPRVEPFDTALQASVDEERMASPLILRPLACQRGLYLGLAMVLSGYTIPRPQTNIILQNTKKNAANEQMLPPVDVTAQVNKEEAKLTAPLNGTIDVLQAFLKYMRGN